MSQGELLALALALFLPRATLPDSPFGFIVIDDPVQAMDPAKVDGLARVLERIGKSHQVIVFTHDDRLPEAVRRLGIDARILQVSRDSGSRVEITTASDPTSRYFDEAHAVVRDKGTDEVVWRRVIPLLCRMAVENACRDVGGWLNGGGRRRAAMAVVGSSSHAGLDRDPVGAIRDVQVLVGDIRKAAS